MSSEVPEGWREAPFSDLARYENGRAFKPADWGTDGLPIVRIAQITNPEAETNRYDGEVDNRHLLKDGDLIFSWSATLAVIKWQRGPAVLNQHLFKVTPAAGVDQDWLQFRLEASISDLTEEAHGTTMKHIRKGTLSSQTTLVPPLAEQRRIAEVLRSVDEAIAASNAVQRSIGVVFRRRRQELIDRARRTSPEVGVAAALRKNRGEKLTKLQTDQYADSGQYPIVDQGARFVCGYTDEKCALWPYDLPVIVFGDHTRILKFVDFPFAIGADGTQCLTPAAGIRPRYLFYALQSLDLRAEGYARHFKLLKEKTIPIPTLDEQESIESELLSIETTELDARQVNFRLGTVKSGLSSDLLSGRVRVPA